MQALPHHKLVIVYLTGHVWFRVRMGDGKQGAGGRGQGAGGRRQGAGGRGQGKRPFSIPSLSFWPSFTPWYKFISLLSLPCHKNQRQLQKFSPGTNWALAHLDKTLQSLGKVILNHRLFSICLKTKNSSHIVPQLIYNI